MYTEIQFLSDPSLIIGYPCHSLTLNLLQLRLLMLLMLMPSNVLRQFGADWEAEVWS